MMGIYEGGPKEPRTYLLKNCIFILTCLNFSHLQCILHLMQYTYRDFFPLLKADFELINFCCFLFHLFHINKTFPFEDCFHSRKQKNLTRGEIGWTGRVGHRGHAVFGQKPLTAQCSVGRCARKSPIMKWANALKKSSKTSHWSRTQPLTTTPAGSLKQMGS